MPNHASRMSSANTHTGLYSAVPSNGNVDRTDLVRLGGFYNQESLISPGLIKLCGGSRYMLLFTS